MRILPMFLMWQPVILCDPAGLAEKDSRIGFRQVGLSTHHLVSFRATSRLLRDPKHTSLPSEPLDPSTNSTRRPEAPANQRLYQHLGQSTLFPSPGRSSLVGSVQGRRVQQGGGIDRP
ncbi:hypothetical protein F5Y09DRAFT_294875 [Xylaria sp. FL1042]|nr:hypothetical protein F5Y09DRAFT_294875 [Xylaria sp. FL1042]